MYINNNVWYRIPLYQGYELCIGNYICPYSYRLNELDGRFFTVRSFKNFKRYPEGYFLPYLHFTKNKNGIEVVSGKYYEMSDISNKRCRLTIDQVIELVNNSDGYIHTQGTDSEARNRILYTTKKKNITLSSLLSNSSLIEKK